MGDAALLNLVQWLSPAFPLGSFAYSHGLETAMSEGQVTDAASLQDWIATVLFHGMGRLDAGLLSAAMAGEDPATLSAAARAMAASAERHIEAEAQGAAFARTVSALTDRDIPPMPLPVAVGVAATPLGVPPEQVVALYLQSFAGNLVSCGVRMIPLGQTEGQTVLAALSALCLEVAKAAPHTHWTRLGSAAFGGDLATMRHEHQEVRLYRT